MTKKIIYIFILLVFLLFSCADSFRSRVRIFNNTSYTLTDINFADGDFSTLSAGETSSYEWIHPSSYRLTAVVNASPSVNVKKSVQINILKRYTLKIKLNTDDQGNKYSYLVILEDGSVLDQE